MERHRRQLLAARRRRRGVLIMSEERAVALNLRPRARFHAFAVASDDPITMLSAPIPATERILARTGMAISDFDQIEINEAFAPVPLAWAAHWGAAGAGQPARRRDRARPPARGLGRAAADLAALRARAERWPLGPADDVRGGGMANATIIERL